MLEPRTCSLATRIHSLGSRARAHDHRENVLEPKEHALGSRMSSLDPRAFGFDSNESALGPRAFALDPRAISLGDSWPGGRRARIAG